MKPSIWFKFTVKTDLALSGVELELEGLRFAAKERLEIVISAGDRYIYRQRDEDQINKDDWTLDGWKHVLVSSFEEHLAGYHSTLPDPEFDLDDMELAEIIMEELK